MYLSRPDQVSKNPATPRFEWWAARHEETLSRFRGLKLHLKKGKKTKRLKWVAAHSQPTKLTLVAMKGKYEQAGAGTRANSPTT